MTKDKLSQNMKRIEKLIWKHFRYELNSRSMITMSYNEHAFYLTVSANTNKKGVDKVLETINNKIIDDTIEVYQIEAKKIMIGSVETAEDSFRWSEAKLSAEMEGLLELKKLVLEKKKALIPVIKGLVEAQNTLPEGSELRKYTKESFESL